MRKTVELATKPKRAAPKAKVSCRPQFDWPHGMTPAGAGEAKADFEEPCEGWGQSG